VKAAKLRACQTRQTYICPRLLYPGFVNVAPLQFREKLTRVHLDQPRGCAKIANVAVAKIAGKISRQQRSIVFASRARSFVSRIVVVITSMREKKMRTVPIRMNASSRVM